MRSESSHEKKLSVHLSFSFSLYSSRLLANMSAVAQGR